MPVAIDDYLPKDPWQFGGGTGLRLAQAPADLLDRKASDRPGVGFDNCVNPIKSNVEGAALSKKFQAAGWTGDRPRNPAQPRARCEAPLADGLGHQVDFA
jgi:hypothetical protein